MNNDLIKTLYNQYKGQNNHDEVLKNYKSFCKSCQEDLSQIPDNNPGFISIGENPVAGIGYGTSELTKDCQDKMRNQWEKEYKPRLEAIKQEVNEQNVSCFSEQVKKDRGKAQNLFVNRCIITLRNDELLAIANIEDLKLLFHLLEHENNYTPKKNKNIEWYENNKKIFEALANELQVVDKPELSMFGWFLKENLLQISSLEKTLENCHNIIFTGAPGTGKTFTAKNIAKHLNAEMKFVQFHPSYDYTDFVEGLRPTMGANTFVRQNGIFKEFCKDAAESLLNDSDTKYIMIIDEINRGEISKIFGELFYSIDPGYRVKKQQLHDANNKQDDNEKAKAYGDFAIKTQYQNLIDTADPFRFGFFVPENVYIIGTMNDIDRSVESMDFAMRRRFTFVEFISSEHLGMFNEIDDYETKKLAIAKMKALNTAIVNSKIGGLAQSYQIGGSYFIHVNEYKDLDDKWEALWNYHLQGLLYEYFRGLPVEEITTKMDSLKKVYDDAGNPPKDRKTKENKSEQEQ